MSLVCCGDSEIDIKLHEWMKWDKNEKTREELSTLAAQGDVEELRKRLGQRMEFGTAGLRARMGAGYSMMNDLTILQTTQGFLRYMESIENDRTNLKQHGVVVGYDGRHNSHKWACLVSSVLLHAGVPVYLFSKVVPTPFVPYTVRHCHCVWGIMITASHNPKWDNGYKVYYKNGAQIIPPHDKGISASIESHLEPWSTAWDTSILSSNTHLLHDPYNDILTSYMHDVTSLCHHRAANGNTSLRFTYTAMHGTGYEAFTHVFKVFNLPPFIPVREQIEPDPEFPTVKFPNPEEGKSALDLSIKTAEENNSTVILANDPDADRLAVAERQPSGQWRVFSGNEMGSLLGWWLWEQHRQTTKQKDLGETGQGEVYCLASTVSSKILRSIAQREGCRFLETLTGFKWMGNASDDLVKQGHTVLFAFEEAIGFMCGTNVLDKDGVSAGAVAAEMACWLHSQGVSLAQQLDNIYTTYGHHVSSNSYFICHDPPTIQQLFHRLRNFNGPNTYPESCGPYSIKYVRDLTTGYDNSEPDNKAVLPVSKSSEMITFTFDNGCVATMRTSGTEPKIKYYTEMVSDPDKGMSREKVTEELSSLVACLIEHFYEPKKKKVPTATLR